MAQEVSCIEEGLLTLEKVEEDKAVVATPEQEADDLTCAICLDQIAMEDVCVIKGCQHEYCGEAQCPVSQSYSNSNSVKQHFTVNF